MRPLVMLHGSAGGGQQPPLEALRELRPHVEYWQVSRGLHFVMSFALDDLQPFDGQLPGMGDFGVSRSHAL